MLSEKSRVEGCRDFGPMIIITDLLQLSYRELLFIQVFISVRPFVMLERMARLMVLVEM